MLMQFIEHMMLHETGMKDLPQFRVFPRFLLYLMYMWQQLGGSNPVFITLHVART